MPRRPTRPYPIKTIQEAASLAESIRSSNPAGTMNRILLAEAMQKSPNGNDFRDLVTASLKFGFTEGNYGSDHISLTELGEQLTKPRQDSERLGALRKGLSNISLFEQLLESFNNRAIPEGDFLKNTLERDPFNVPPEWASEAADIFVLNGKAVGYIRRIGSNDHVILDAGPPVKQIEQLTLSVPAVSEDSIGQTFEHSALESHNFEEVDQITEPPQESGEEFRRESQKSERSLQFFIAHGRDLEALQEVQRILDKLGIPYMIAAEEANVGRPISRKVKELMDACTGGIFIFSADEEFRDRDGNTIFRPRENVIYELGAASYVYDQSIVIFKERGVSFPTDFRDLGYIEYEKGQLAGKTMELLTELIALKAIKLLPGG